MGSNIVVMELHKEIDLNSSNVWGATFLGINAKRVEFNAPKTQLETLDSSITPRISSSMRS